MERAGLVLIMCKLRYGSRFAWVLSETGLSLAEARSSKSKVNEEVFDGQSLRTPMDHYKMPKDHRRSTYFPRNQRSQGFEPHWCCICEKSGFKHVLTRSSKPSEGHTEWYTEKHIDNTVINVGVSSDNGGPERTPRSMPENIPMTTNSPCLLMNSPIT
ncbi:hypothetical protein Tco_0411954 [Tanacetum coccineum]